MKSIDFIILCYNEDENINELTNDIFENFKNVTDLDINIIWIDNGSTDNSLDIIKKLSREDQRIKCISLSRNFGQQPALHAGLIESTSDYTCIMDGDQQDPPKDALNMYNLLLKENKDVVYAVRDRRNENFFKIILYKIFYRIWSAFADIDVKIDSGEFSIFSSQVRGAILQSKEFHRFNRGLRSWAGFSQEPYYHFRPKRKLGDQKINFYNATKLAVDAILSFSLKPIRFVFFAGLTLSFFSLIFILIKILNIFSTEDYIIPFFSNISNYLDGSNLIFLFTQGIIFMFLGIIGEYVGRIYEQVKNRPNFIIKERINLNK